jgi:hypothetical protein
VTFGKNVWFILIWLEFIFENCKGILWKIPKIVVSLLLLFTNIHFVELPLYENDLLQPSNDSRSFHDTHEYASWQIENSIYSWLVISLRDEDGVYEERINEIG